MKKPALPCSSVAHLVQQSLVVHLFLSKSCSLIQISRILFREEQTSSTMLGCRTFQDTRPGSSCCNLFFFFFPTVLWVALSIICRSFLCYSGEGHNRKTEDSGGSSLSPTRFSSFDTHGRYRFLARKLQAPEINFVLLIKQTASVSLRVRLCIARWFLLFICCGQGSLAWGLCPEILLSQT